MPSDPAAGGASVGGGLLAQDEIETCVHNFLSPGSDGSELTPEETVYRVIGGMGPPFKISIDQVLVHSTYRPTVAVAKTYSSEDKAKEVWGANSFLCALTGSSYGMLIRLLSRTPSEY